MCRLCLKIACNVFSLPSPSEVRSPGVVVVVLMVGFGMDLEPAMLQVANRRACAKFDLGEEDC